MLRSFSLDLMITSIVWPSCTTMSPKIFPTIHLAIFAKTGDNTYVIEMALAGFARHDIEIEFVDDKLIVRGNAKEDDNGEYIFKGIAARNFTRTFAINDHIEIKDAELFNGMLKIALERLIPEHKKAKKIEVKEGGKASAKQAAERRQITRGASAPLMETSWTLNLFA
jgi:HSP20 family molecular chaperone IbpA